MNYQPDQAARSYAEVRLLVIFAAGLLLLALGLPALLRAVDSNGDNLDDTWEAQYGFTTNAYASTNLVGWWQLNGTNSTDNATDRSGNGITGTLSGFPSVAYGAGLFSNALYFTTNGTVSFPTTNTALNATNQFTFSAWFQATNNLSQPATIATWSDAATNGWSVGVATNGVANITFFDGATEQVVAATSGTINLYDGNWHEVAATYTTNQAATVYVDGTGEATNTITGWTPGTVSSFTFGAPNTNTVDNPFILDETRLYNRALGATEIPQLPVTYSDLNGSGLTVIQDFLENLNPLSTTGIVTSGFISSGLTSYYSSNVPTLTKTGGDGQTVSASTFATNALVVHVVNSSGTALVGAPITFSIPSGSDGGIALTSGGTTTASLSLTTDSSGNATVYYQSGPDAFKTNTIQATAVYNGGSVSVSFTAICGVQSGLTLWLRADQGVTSSSGSVSAWADQSPNGNNASQTTSTIRPTVVTNVINGNPVIRFNGSSQYFTLPAGFSNFSSGVTAFAVFTPTSTASWARIFDIAHGAPGDNIILAQYGTALTMAADTYSGSTEHRITGSTELTLSVPQEYTMLQNGGSSLQLYRNGGLLGQNTNVTALSNVTRNLNYIAKSNWSGDGLYQGDMAEILIYNRPLTSTEQQLVEVYLANKYGLYSPYATWPLSYSSAVQAEITKHQWNNVQANNYVALQSSNPTMLTNGLTLWLRADAGVTTSSGKVTAIADQTGNYTLTQSTTANQPTYVSSDLNGKPGLRFSSSQWLYGAGSFGPGLNQDMTTITVGMTTNPPASQQFALYLGQNAAAYVNRTYLYYGGAEYFDGQGGGCAGGPAGAANVFVTEASLLNSALTQVTFYQNGVQTAVSTAPGTLKNLSYGITMGAATGGYVGWQGDIVEQLVYDHQLSSTELQQVGQYIGDKYLIYNPNATWPLAYSSAVQAEIARNQWNKTQADAYAAFLATSPAVPPTGLTIWLRADLGVTSSSGSVSAWADQGPTGNSASQSTSSARPTLVASALNGQPVLRFNGTSSYLSIPDNASLKPTTGLTILVAARPQASSNYGRIFTRAYRADSSFTTPYVSYGLGQDAPSQTTYFQTGHAGNVLGSINSQVLSSGQPVLLTGTYGSSTDSLYLSGVLQATTTTPGNISYAGATSVNVAIGTTSPARLAEFFNGDVAEVLMYNRVLTSTEQQQAEVYLANKYGLYHPYATWPSTYSSAVQAEITKHQWNKAQADSYVAFQAANSTMLTNGLTLWLKADAGVTTSSGSVTAIADQTGNYTLTQSNSANQPTYISSDLNGKPGLRFSGNQWLYGSGTFGPSLNSDMTIITVGMSTSPAATQYGLYLGQNATAGANRAFVYAGGSELLDAQYAECYGGTAPPANTFVMESATLNSAWTGVAFYQNGVQTATGTVSGTFANLSYGMTMGAATGGYVGWHGDIVEQLVYDHQLSSTELQQVGAYLANKYGLYYNVAPVITPAAGSYSSSQTVSISTALTAGTIQYTLDGTDPTASSPAYTGSITLTGDALVSAAVFFNGVRSSPIASSQFYINDTGNTGLPTAATGLTTTVVSGSEIDLAWSLSGQLNYYGVNVYRSSDGGATYQLVATLDPSATSFADTNVSAGTNYQYVVGTDNTSGESDTSASSSVTPTAATAINATITTPSDATPWP